ncbi:hypothetical protein HYW76_01245 [Candidatus Pacearchaeota archaeon]|nr:hypothetical protein [Candidatus Pacearchaeota archaeon]
MSWLFGGNKKQEAKRAEGSRLPELPELPPLEDSFSDKQVKYSGRSSLPSYPSFNPIKEKTSNEEIKQAIVEPPSFQDENSEVQLPKKPMTKEIGEEIQIPSIMDREPISRESLKIPKTPRMQTQERNIPQRQILRNEPLFIRIDKYQDSISDLEEVKRRILEIEDVLKNIRDVRAKEEVELQQWEAEIHEAKMNLDKIDRTIFQKLGE